jgi:hypothetical protein
MEKFIPYKKLPHFLLYSASALMMFSDAYAGT